MSCFLKSQVGRGPPPRSAPVASYLLDKEVRSCINHNSIALVAPDLHVCCCGDLNKTLLQRVGQNTCRSAGVVGVLAYPLPHFYLRGKNCLQPNYKFMSL
jgi:hypothetical protein